MTTALTPEQLIEVDTQLAFIKVLRGQIDERMAKQQDMDDEDPATLAYVIVTGAMLEIGNEHVDELAALLGVDGDPEEKLAKVIELFDGNRRMGHG
jgi:hypothetical protein